MGRSLGALDLWSLAQQSQLAQLHPPCSLQLQAFSVVQLQSLVFVSSMFFTSLDVLAWGRSPLLPQRSLGLVSSSGVSPVMKWMGY